VGRRRSTEVAYRGEANHIDPGTLRKEGEYYVNYDPLGADYPKDGYGQMVIRLLDFTVEIYCIGLDDGVVRDKAGPFNMSATATRDSTGRKMPELTNSP